MSIQKKSVLGRGLEALIPKFPAEEVSIRREDAKPDTGENNIIATIPIVDVRPNPHQPRAEFDEQALEELKQSILEKGVIQPITVRRVTGGYELVSGERRLRATQNAGIDQIPAYIIQVDSDEDMLELALIENLQREQLNPIEVAIAFQNLLDQCSLTQEEVAQKVGKERSTVANFLRLLKLPQRIQVALRRNELTMGHARALLALGTESEQLRLYEKIVKNDLSVRKVEQIVKLATTVTYRKKHKQAAPPSAGGSHVDSVEERLRNLLGTKVNVRARNDGTGEIVIDFFSYEDLDRLIELFEEIGREQ